MGFIICCWFRSLLRDMNDVLDMTAVFLDTYNSFGMCATTVRDSCNRDVEGVC